MTNEKIKEVLTNSGVPAKEVEKIQGRFNLAKITEIVEAASSPDEAFTSLHDFCPELEIEKLHEECNFVVDQILISNRKAASWKGVLFGVTVDFCASSCAGGVPLGGFALNSLITCNAA
jgi:hypothetical protein